MADKPEVKLKSDAVEVKPEEPKKIDLPPFHTEETFKIAQQREKEAAENAKRPYAFSANGYTVKQRKAEDQEKSFADADGFVYDVDGNDLPRRVYGEKRDAEIFCETHAPHFGAISPTQPSV